jgi:hypothetical protein
MKDITETKETAGGMKAVKEHQWFCITIPTPLHKRGYGLAI